MIAHPAQKPLVQFMDIHIAGHRIMDAADQAIAANTRNLLDHFISRQPRHIEMLGLIGLISRIEHLFLTCAANIEDATRRKNRMRRKARWRLQEECTARASQRAGMSGAIGFHEHGGGSTGGMIAGLRFPLQNNNRCAAQAKAESK